MKKVLIISPQFPPLNARALQRVRMSLPFFAAHGWERVVLALGDAWQHGTREPELLATLPPATRIVRTRGVPHWLSRLLGVRNTGLRAWPFFLLHGAWLLATEKFDLVYFSNSQFATFTLGGLWRRWFGVPYVIDVQDPWLTDFYERPGAPRPPGGWKYQIARAQAWALEGWTYRRAAGIIAVSPHYLADLRRRYRQVAALPTDVIGFGASRADLHLATSLAADQPAFTRGSPDEVHLVYTGVAGPVMRRALEVLFDGLRRYREKSPQSAARLRFHFVGTRYAAQGEDQDSVQPFALAAGVADQIAEVSHRIGHLEALRWQVAADALILLGTDDPAYSPSKLYPYLLTGRPLLAVVTRGSVAEQLLDEFNASFTVRLADAGTGAEAITENTAFAELHRFFDLALAGFPAGSRAAVRTAHFETHFLAEPLTRRQCALFSRALDRQPPVI